MKNRIEQIWLKHREIITYLIVGGLTTVVSWSAKYLWNFVFYHGVAYPTNLQNFILSAVEWVAGVAFAYPANKRWVFKSKNTSWINECSAFVISRIGTLFLNIIMMQVLVNLLRINVYVSTIISAVVVVVTNFVLSKKYVFKNE